MSRKRRNTSSAEPDSPPKRSRSISDSSEQSLPDRYEQPTIDPNYGQVGAFPGLISAGDLFYGPAQDGFDYLRMVRSEASSIPVLLTAKHEVKVVEQETEYHNGFFDEDEAFVAAPVEVEASNTDLGRSQSLYYESVLLRFRSLQAELRSSPPLESVRQLPEHMPISFPSMTKSAKERWSSYTLQNEVHPVQVACMDSESVLEWVRLLTRKMRIFLHSSNEQAVQRIGSWVWAMLARCPDRGELGSEEISDLRACAKAADTTWQWLQERGSDATIHAESLDNVSEEEEDMSTVDASDVTADAQPRSRIVPHDLSRQELNDARNTRRTCEMPTKGQRIILDMIITVVGEVYGQRDLLELRRPWESLVASSTKEG